MVVATLKSILLLQAVKCLSFQSTNFHTLQDCSGSCRITISQEAPHCYSNSTSWNVLSVECVTCNCSLGLYQGGRFNLLLCAGWGSVHRSARERGFMFQRSDYSKQLYEVCSLQPKCFTETGSQFIEEVCQFQSMSLLPFG